MLHRPRGTVDESTRRYAWAVGSSGTASPLRTDDVSIDEGIKVHYQVVARPDTADACWDYYPYWAPTRDREDAERLAYFAAQTGHEAVILECVTVERLEAAARAVVERQDTSFLPALRYLPAAERWLASERPQREVTAPGRPEPTMEHYADGVCEAEADERRLTLERGPGGDVTRETPARGQRLSFPQRMDVVSAWLRLRARALRGEVGGAGDGTTGS